MDLTPAGQRFVLHWGEMGSRWGINRTVAQIHALLHVSDRALPADEICETLQVARSNVSTSLKELQGWGLVRVAHVFGDRRDHFESLADVWGMFRVILAERRKREVDPTIAVLRECIAGCDRRTKEGRHTAERLQALLDFFETTCAWYDEISGLPAGPLRQFLSLGAQVGRKLRGG